MDPARPFDSLKGENPLLSLPKPETRSQTGFDMVEAASTFLYFLYFFMDPLQLAYEYHQKSKRAARSAKRAKGQRRQYLKQIADKYLDLSRHYWQKSQVKPPAIISAPHR